MPALLAVAVVLLVFGLVSGRLPSWCTPPMVFLTAGLALGQEGLAGLDIDPTGALAEAVVSATLALVLFHDAVRIDVRRLRRYAGLPVRMLAIGLPLAILLGGLLAQRMFDIALALALTIGAVLAPTDAALGQAVVTDERVPERIRQSLNVESGLNDGIALPFAEVFLVLAAGGGGPIPGLPAAIANLALGALVGGAVGAVAGAALSRAARAGFTLPAFRQIAGLATPAVAYVLAELLGGNGFVATFLAGGAFGWAAGGTAEGLTELVEDVGELLTVTTFLVFGAIVAGDAFGRVTLPIVLYAVGSLTVVRMVAVAVSLLGARVRPWTVAYLGWFGPRGLASILYGLLVFEELGDSPEARGAFDIVAVTVVLSIFAHGLTAGPLSSVYARYARRFTAADAEMAPSTSHRTRFGWRL